MGYESYALAFHALSSIVLLAGLYYTYQLNRRTGKASVIWSFLLLVFLTLFLYQAAESVEYMDKGSHAAGPPAGLHASIEKSISMTLEEFAEEFAHTMPVASGAIFLCLALLMRRSLLVPI